MILLDKTEQKASEDVRRGKLVKPGGLVGYLRAEIRSITQAIEDVVVVLDFNTVPCDANIERMTMLLEEEEMDVDFTVVRNLVDMLDDGIDMQMCSYEDLTTDE